MSSKEEVPEEKTTSHVRRGLSTILDFGIMDDDDRKRIIAIALEVAVTSEWVKQDMEKSDPGITERIRALEAQEAQENDKGK